MSGTAAKTTEIHYKSGMQEVLERIKVLVLLPWRGKEKGKYYLPALGDPGKLGLSF